jgi:hypothetical protein
VCVVDRHGGRGFEDGFCQHEILRNGSPRELDGSLKSRAP